MTTAYGYGGEFSSDEEADKMEGQQYNIQPNKPTRSQLEEVIETIRNMSPDQDVNIADDFIAGLLDYYKTSRGPIVDSTRNLYKKILIRLIRGEQPQQTTNGASEQTNGNGPTNNNNFEEDVKSKGPLVETQASSDEDEPMPPASQDSLYKKKFDSRVVEMDVDHETYPAVIAAPIDPITAPIRSIKTLEIPTTSDSETEESSEDSEIPNLTPPEARNIELVTSTPIAKRVSSTTANKVASTEPNKVVSADAKKVAAPEVNKVSSTDAKKKPFTRSQRAAAAAKAIDDINTSSMSKNDIVIRGSKRAQTSKFIISAALVAFVAFFLYYFRSDIQKSTENLIKKVEIKF